MNQCKSYTPKTVHAVLRKLYCLLLASAALFPAGCISDDYGTENKLPDGEFQVNLLIEPQAAMTKAVEDVSAIKQLRVYVFNQQQKKVGYHYIANLQETGEAYYIPLRLAEGGALDFYVVANEAGGGLSLAENTSKEDLDKMQFEVDQISRASGDLLTGKDTATITEANAQDGQVRVVDCPLRRPFSLLEVYVAKAGQGMSAQVNSIGLYDYTTAGFLCDSYSIYDQARTFADGPLSMLGTDADVTAVVAEEEHGTPSADYGTALASTPVALNGQGLTTDWGSSWVNDVPTTRRKPRLEIAYTVGNDAKTATVYLPRMITLNTRYQVKCLIKDTGGLFVTLEPQDWTDEEEHDYDLDDAGSFVITETNLKERVSGNKVYATQYSLESNASARQFTFTLNMTAPEGVRWMAHLTNSSDFEFVIDENHAAEGVGGAGEVTIWVRPTKSFEATAERATTELYVTLGTAPNTKQTVDNKMDYTIDTQTFHIEQVSQQEGDAIWGSSVQP